MKFFPLQRLPCGLLATLICVTTCLGANPNSTANTNASADARAVLKYFQDLSKRPNKRLISGQFTDFGNGAGLRLMEDIKTKTGHSPGILGADYADFGKGGLTFEKPNAAAIAWWRQGGLVTLSAHLYNPANPKGGGLRDKGVDLATLLEAGTETHERWMRELDQLAAGLQELTLLRGFDLGFRNIFVVCIRKWLTWRVGVSAKVSKSAVVPTQSIPKAPILCIIRGRYVFAFQNPQEKRQGASLVEHCGEPAAGQRPCGPAPCALPG